MSSVNGDGFLSKFPSVCMVSLVFACFALLHRLEPLAQQSAERVWREPSSLPFSQAWGERTQCLAIKLMLTVGFSFFFSFSFLSSFLFFLCVCVCVCVCVSQGSFIYLRQSQETGFTSKVLSPLRKAQPRLLSTLVNDTLTFFCAGCCTSPIEFLSNSSCLQLHITLHYILTLSKNGT